MPQWKCNLNISVMNINYWWLFCYTKHVGIKNLFLWPKVVTTLDPSDDSLLTGIHRTLWEFISLIHCLLLSHSSKVVDSFVSLTLYFKFSSSVNSVYYIFQIKSSQHVDFDHFGGQMTLSKGSSKTIRSTIYLHCDS